MLKWYNSPIPGYQHERRVKQLPRRRIYANISLTLLSLFKQFNTSFDQRIAPRTTNPRFKTLTSPNNTIFNSYINLNGFTLWRNDKKKGLFPTYLNLIFAAFTWWQIFFFCMHNVMAISNAHNSLRFALILLMWC